jgi:tRNA(Arg) A34 adenosine deaminase TadA
MWYIQLAAETARVGIDRRQYAIGAVAVRNDGTVVRSRNLPIKTPLHAAHAEVRLCKKIDLGATVYLARVLRDGSLAVARPCPRCHALLKLKGVRRVFFTVSNGEIESIKLN